MKVQSNKKPIVSEPTTSDIQKLIRGTAKSNINLIIGSHKVKRT